MRFRVLGPVDIETADATVLTLARRQERCLLGILLLHPGQAVAMDRLCDLMWDDDPPEHARPAIRTYVARIRAVLARADAPAYGVRLISRGGGYLLETPPELVDAHRFRSLLHEAAGAAPVTRQRLLHEAIDLWRGPALDRAATDRLRRRLCADLDELRYDAIEEAIAAGLELGQHRELLPDLDRLTAEYPTRERLVELHMLALHRSGRSSEALELYRRIRTRRADDLGLDPGRNVQTLYQEILRGEPAPSVTPALLPADLPVFSGRRAQLDQLDELLDGDGTTAVISAIAGTAGVGKTALAVHWAHRATQRFSDGQLYVDLRGFGPGSAMHPAEAVRRFLDVLAVPASRFPPERDKQMQLYRSLLAERRMLIVLDNARDAAQITPLLPGSGPSVVLVTSRNAIAIDRARTIAVDLLNGGEARDLLAARIGAARIAAEPDAVEEIVARCAGLPLALAIVAARAATQPELTLRALADEFNDRGGALGAFDAGDAVTNLETVFSWSYRALANDAARLFRLLGRHPGPDISAAAAASLAGIAPPAVGPLLTELRQANLLTERRPGRYAFHDLLRQYATQLTDPDERPAQRRMFDHYTRTAHVADRLLAPTREEVHPLPAGPAVTPEPLTDQAQATAWFAAEHAVLLATIDLAGRTGFDQHAWHLAWAVATHLYRHGHWSQLIDTHQAAVDAARRLADGNREAYAHRDLANAYTSLGRGEEAQTHLEHALRLYEALDNHIGQAETHLSLGWVYELQGRPDNAVHHAERALTAYQMHHHSTGEANALNAVGWYNALLGRLDHALDYCQRALALHQRLDDRDGQAHASRALGHAHHHLGQHHQAVALYRNAADLWRGLDNQYWLADTLTRLGDTSIVLGDTDAAGTAWQEALSILTDMHHPTTDQLRAKLSALP